MRIRALVLLGLCGVAPHAAAQCGTLWTLLSPTTSPPIRSNHAMATDTVRGRIVLFGGLTVGGVALGDTWEWDGANWILRATSGPSPRYSHVMSYDSARQRVVLFGGSTPNDTWEWDGQTWTQRMIAGPALTFSSGMAFDAARQRTVLIGYQGSNATWEYDGTAWVLRATGGPWLSGIFYDTIHQRCLAVSPDDTRAWTGSDWVILPSNAHPFYSFRVSYDAVRHRAVGVYSNSQPDTTWEWDSALSTWRYRTPTGPSFLSGPALAYDTVSGRTILFCTNYSLPGTPAATWAWSGDDTAGPAFTLMPVTEQTVAPGAPVSVSAAAVSSSPPLTFQWYHYGVPLTPGGIYSGVNTPTLSFTPTSVLHGGSFVLRASDACGMLEVRTYVVVDCYPNCDHSAIAPFLNVNDYSCFMNVYASGSSYANCDGSTTLPVLNVNDFICFMNRFAEGCP